ncbi:MAG TPA: bifunctional DNA primase/polymerase, partial [Desulfobaccales bacterium]
MATRENNNVRVSGDEMGQILNLKQNLEHHDQLWGYVNRYRAIGWEVAIVRARGGGEVEIDLAQPEESWWKQLGNLGLTGIQVNLAIRTGRPSRLLVLEVNKGQGTLSLDLLGDWRSPCVAELDNCREQHYYTLPPDQPPPSSHFLAQEVLIYANGGLILAPPSIESEGREPWRWVTPPWEMAPQPPQPAVWQFIQEQTAGGGGTPAVPSWEEIYQAVVPYGTVLKALLGPPTTMEQYYREILQAALSVGLSEQQLLLGLLWHAPNGDARTNGERWKQLQGLVAVAQPTPGRYQAVSGLKPDGEVSPAGVRPGQAPPPDPPVP